MGLKVQGLRLATRKFVVAGFVVAGFRAFGSVFKASVSGFGCRRLSVSVFWDFEKRA